MTTETDMLADVGNRDPVTQSQLTSHLAALGVRTGMTVLVHCSMSRLGWIPGGVQALLQALLDTLGPAGNLVVPAHSSHLSEPSRWQAPPVPEDWWAVIRAEMPAFDPVLTPTRAMGALAEAVRCHPDAKRSRHPQGSFAALGPDAGRITQVHDLGSMFGDRSPLGTLYSMGAYIALLGVGHGNNTSLHLAEYRARFPGKRTHLEGAPLLRQGRRVWHTFEEIAVDDADFSRLGADFAAATGRETEAQLGWGTGCLMPMRDLVDYAVPWLERNR